MRRILKGMLNCLALAAALPLIVWAGIPLVLFRSEGSYASAACAAAIVPGHIGLLIRRAFYCVLLPECQWDVDVNFGSLITHPTARLGHRVSIGGYSLLGRCRIEDDVLIASRVSVLSGRYPHRFDSADRRIAQQQGELREVSIGQDSWLGEGCIVMADIGKGCVVGAGSVVVHPVQDLWIVAGNPARRIGVRGIKDSKSSAS